MRARTTVMMALAALCGASAHAAPGDVWHLQQILMHDKLDERAEVIDHYADHYGGHAIVQVDGDLGDICPGDSTAMIFNWGLHGDDDIQGGVSIAEGTLLTVRLFASPGSPTPCRDVLGAASYITAAGSDTDLPPPLSAKTMKAVDARRFTDPGGSDARATPAANVEADSKLLFVAAEPLPGKIYAYFQIRIVIPGSERELRFIYVYSREAAPEPSPEIGNPPPPPG